LGQNCCKIKSDISEKIKKKKKNVYYRHFEIEYKQASKRKKIVFSLKRDVINLRDVVITPINVQKKLGSDQQRQPNIFVLQALLKKLQGGGK